MALIIGIILILFIIVFLIYSKRKISLVKENSLKLNKVLKLNENYKFHKNVKDKKESNYFVKSKTDLSKINLDDVLLDEIFFDNVDNVYMNLKYVIDNEEKYEVYSKKYNAINDVTDPEIIAVTNIKLKNFLFLEKRLYKKYKLKPVTSMKFNLIAKFSSPKGDNKYQKNKSYKYDELKTYYDKYEKRGNENENI